MPSVLFSYRLIIDKDFYKDIKTKKIQRNPSLMIMLMRINDKSKGISRRHNVMSKKIFDEILNENPNMPREILRASFYPLDNESIEIIDDEIERNIKLAIDLLDEEPNRSLILTSEETKEKYLNNPHFQNVKEIDVKYGDEALTILDKYFYECSA